MSLNKRNPFFFSSSPSLVELGCFNDISTIVGYLMSNHAYTYI